MSKQDDVGGAKGAPPRKRVISQAPPPTEPLPRGSYMAPSNAKSDRPLAETRRKISQAESGFRMAESYCYEAIFDGRRKDVSKQQWAGSIKPRWSEVRPQLDQAFNNCRDVGTPTDELSELDGRLKRLDYKWKLVCQSRERASSNPVPVAMAGNETRAIEALKLHLESNPHLGRKDAAIWCRDKGFALTARGFQNRVWPRARTEAKLDAKAKPGRKPKSSH
jgi:hypothetical protein